MKTHKLRGFFLFRTKGRKNNQASNLFLAVIFYVCPLYLIFCSRFKKWLYKYEFMKLFFYFSSSFFFSILTFRSLNAIGHKMHIITITRRYILELKTVLVFYVRFVHSGWCQPFRTIVGNVCTKRNNSSTLYTIRVLQNMHY